MLTSKIKFYLIRNRCCPQLQGFIIEEIANFLFLNQKEKIVKFNSTGPDIEPCFFPEKYPTNYY